MRQLSRMFRVDRWPCRWWFCQMPSLAVLFLLSALLLLSASCGGREAARRKREVDSLNAVAYSLRYRDVKASGEAARQAMERSGDYAAGEAEAVNHLGFCALIAMDFEEAERLHKRVYGLTRNEVERLAADVGLMKVYQRTALNKEFYDYRNSALRRMKRIDEEGDLPLEPHELERLRYARSEFGIVSAVYYYYLQQRPQALEAMDDVLRYAAPLEADTNQLLYYHYILGAASLTEGETADARRLREFDELFRTWRMAGRGGWLYFEGNGVQGLANLMASPAACDFFLQRRSYALQQFGFPLDSLLPLRLGRLALLHFRRYDDLYQTAGAYVSIGRYLNAHGRYEEALDTLVQALECVNDHHRRFYDCHDSLDWLRPYDPDPERMPVENNWVGQKLKTVPEWISRIREQLSVTYAGLKEKPASDYNRNIYLDILEDTRQDRELESRLQALEQESVLLNGLLCAVLGVLLLVFLFFHLFNRRSRIRNRQHMERLQLLLDICQQITAAIPLDAGSEEEILESIERAIRPGLDTLFRRCRATVTVDGLELHGRPGKDEQALARVIRPYILWALSNGLTAISLDDEQRRLENLRYVHERHIAGNKRQNLVKKACFSIVEGMQPYIGRMVGEVHKLLAGRERMAPEVRGEKYQYIDELVDRLNEYNDILALWIQMRQGSLSLNVETFGLDELFALVEKGGRAFRMKEQTLEVERSGLLVKADRALTLFMINTLAENARKYTPRGGRVRIYARGTEEYVEVSVEDNGPGLSEADVARITGEKVYDSRSIGLDGADDPDELRRNKGTGFGLMNCRGIIEKYRKTNPLFHVCLFSVESRRGAGSRFFFRLPAGVRRALGCLLMVLFPLSLLAGTARTDTLPPLPRAEYELLLDSASNYANTAYYCNVDGEYEWALVYIDSAISCLNAHYERYAPPSSPRRLMTLTGDDEPAELFWWEEPYDSDFHVILDLRNEAAVAFLALSRWEPYRYNNEAYTALYKLLGEDRSIEGYCNQLQHSASHKMVALLLGILLLLALPGGYYFLYLRRRRLNRLNLEQLLEINRRVSGAARLSDGETEEMLRREEDTLTEIPRRIVTQAFGAVNDLIPVVRLGLAVADEAAHRLEFAACPAFPAGEEPAGSAEQGEKESLKKGENVAGSVEQREEGSLKKERKESAERWQELMHRCHATASLQTDGPLQAFPLLVDAGGEHRCVGVLCLQRADEAEQEGERLLLELMTRQVAIVVFNAVVKLAGKYRDIETAQDEVRRVSFEDSQLHVQNQVLDNCLSTIKHETIYYPNKIKQLIAKLRRPVTEGPDGKTSPTPADEWENLQAIGELADYYQGIFGILSSCASRQLEEVTFRRSRVETDALLESARKYFRKAVKGKAAEVVLETKPSSASQPSSLSSTSSQQPPLCVSGDVHLLRFLLENLIDEALETLLPGRLELEAVPEGEFVRFLFTDHRRTLPPEQLHALFYPSLARMTAGGTSGRLCGTEFLVCRQIIRDHDEFAGRRGCRINAEPVPDGGGMRVYFTLLKSSRKVT